ncbi:MAG TPA: hypothetical protein VNP92_24135 [Actinophytocola sp.]|nr:hypothetical protein [Actinophytocola sp.]
MVNTRLLTTAVEDHVRDMLSAKYQVAFRKERLRLQPGGEHEFDAVSTDRRIVASIKTASAPPNGKHPSAKVVNAIAELYFLSVVRASKRLLVLTSADFHALFLGAMNRKIAGGIEVVHLPLPTDIEARVAAVQSAASDEIQPVLDPDELRAVGGR